MLFRILLLINVVSIILSILSVAGDSQVTTLLTFWASPVHDKYLSQSQGPSPTGFALLGQVWVEGLCVTQSKTLDLHHYRNRINSILLSHFILALRSIYLDPELPTIHPTQSHRSALQFAATVEGNIGTSLDFSWIVMNVVDESDEVQNPRYSSNPFAAGLLMVDQSVIEESSSSDLEP